MYPVVPLGPDTLKVISLLVELKIKPDTVELDETENTLSSMSLMAKLTMVSAPATPEPPVYTALIL